MMKRPLSAMPLSSISTPYLAEMDLVTSAIRGICIKPRPPLERGVLQEIGEEEEELSTQSLAPRTIKEAVSLCRVGTPEKLPLQEMK
jgi:hypothetical protein